MKKYRITSDGDLFRVEYRNWFTLWTWEKWVTTISLVRAEAIIQSLKVQSSPKEYIVVKYL